MSRSRALAKSKNGFIAWEVIPHIPCEVKHGYPQLVGANENFYGAFIFSGIPPFGGEPTMPSVPMEKEWEIRRLASKYIHAILTDVGEIDEAKLVAAMILNILLHPVEVPPRERAPELIKLVFCA